LLSLLATLPKIGTYHHELIGIATSQAQHIEKEVEVAALGIANCLSL